MILKGGGKEKRRNTGSHEPACERMVFLEI